MSAVLPDAERLLSEQRTLRPFGSTLSADDRIVAVGVTSNSEAFDAAALVLEFQNSFRDGAARGELKATALVYTARDERSDPPLSVVRVNLDHRENYSIVVSFPYRFSEAGELFIDEPFAAEGAYDVFAG